MSKQPSIVLVGPTGSGKSPLGNHLEAVGLWGRRSVHFDFGFRLRKIREAGISIPSLTPEERKVVNRVLESGALLEDREFPIALKIFQAFLTEKSIAKGDLVILNGLPRHPGQAVGLDPFVRIEAVAVLECTANTIFRRIASDAGGDRDGRMDDSAESIARKLSLFLERTLPLLDHYRNLGVPVFRVPVGVSTTPQDMARKLESVPGMVPGTGTVPGM